MAGMSLRSLTHSSFLAAALFSISSQICFASCDEVQFNLRNYDTRGHPTAVAVGNLNGDSNLDFVIPASLHDVYVFYGLGTGRFFGPRRLESVTFPQDLLVSDFNKDGFADLAILGASELEVLLGNGDGTFGAPVIYSLTGGPTHVVASDFNHDGIVDLAVNGDNVTVFLGTGTGTFGPPIESTGILAGNMAAGDFDEDGLSDLAFTLSTTLSIAHSDGLGHFTVTKTYPLDGDATEVAVGDFNNDGHLDLAAGSINIVPNNNVRIFLGRGNGDFNPGDRVPSFSPHGIVTADFNGDGNIDLAAANFTSLSLVTFAIGDGTGHFSSLFTITVPGSQPYPINLASADFNGDGRADLVTANNINGSATVFASAPCDQ
jgi:hypothetical protein